MVTWRNIAEWFDVNGEKLTLAVGGVGVGFSLAGIQWWLPFDWAWLAIVFNGLPIIWGAAVAMYEEFDVKADLLVSLALVAAVAIGEYFAAAEIAFIMQLGAMLEEFTVSKAQSGIEKLVDLTPTTARLIRNNKEEILPADVVMVGDVIRVFPGEIIPVDGTICSGSTSIDQSVMTGESMPIDRTVGDEVFSGTLNQFGAFDMVATKEGTDSSIQRMIKLVQATDPGNAKIVSIADRWATWIVGLALLTAIGTYIVTGDMIRAVTILVVFCPCALVLATPAAIMAAISNASKHGFLVKRGSIMEELSKVDTITFDKTGTLTHGTPQVVGLYSMNHMSEAELYRVVASAEQQSEHPLGRAIVAGYTSSYDAPMMGISDVSITPGKGLTATVGGETAEFASAIHLAVTPNMDQAIADNDVRMNTLNSQSSQVLAGNEAMMAMSGIVIPDTVKASVDEYLVRGASIVYVAINSVLTGYVALADRVRSESRSVVDALHGLDVTPVLLTGDHTTTAQYIAKPLNVSHVMAECLPEDKLHVVAKLQDNGHVVAMVGDGVNDALALKKSDVGIAMGGMGSDIAVEAADIVLVNDTVQDIPHLVALSKKMMNTIKINLTFSLLLNGAAIILAMVGSLSPVWGALVHNGGSLLVVVNSALLLTWSYKKMSCHKPSSVCIDGQLQDA